MRPIPLGTRFYKNKSLPVSCQNLVCLYAEFLDSDSKSRVILHQLPGNTSDTTFTSGPVRGSKFFKDELYIVSGNSLYKRDSVGVKTTIGTITGSGRVSMACNETQLCIVNGTSVGYIYDSATLSTQALTGPAYKVRYLDGYFIFDYSGTGNWFISSVDDGTTFDATETGGHNAKPDSVIAIEISQGKVYVFGNESVEPFYNSGKLDFPFIRINEGVIRKGCQSRWSIQEINENIIFLGSDKDGDIEVYRIAGIQVTKISDPAISEVLNTLSKTDDAESWSFNYRSHSFYVLTFPTANRTFIYDLTTGLWAEWGELSDGSYIRHRGRCYAAAYGKHFIGDHTNGTLFELTGYLDNSNPIRWEFVTPFIHAGGDRLEFPPIRIDMETGEADATGQGSNPVFEISYSSDGKNFDGHRLLSFGKTGEYNKQIWMHRNGSDVQRCWKVAWTDPVKNSVAGMYFDAD